jgi:hypothetical protein
MPLQAKVATSTRRRMVEYLRERFAFSSAQETTKISVTPTSYCRMMRVACGYFT